MTYPSTPSPAEHTPGNAGNAQDVSHDTRGRDEGGPLGPLTLRSIARDYADVLDDSDPRREWLRPLCEVTP